ncbi:MAG: hypothetical protein K5761_01620 [Clostridiales bacterium]|nr:hypothetical protein [Clostridiales bacterium]
MNKKNELYDYESKYGLRIREWCSESENQKYEEMLKNGEKLPNGIHKLVGKNTFFTVKEELSKEEKEEYLTYIKLDLLKSIKGYLLFFVILTIVGAISVLISLLIN